MPSEPAGRLLDAYTIPNATARPPFVRHAGGSRKNSRGAHSYEFDQTPNPHRRSHRPPTVVPIVLLIVLLLIVLLLIVLLLIVLLLIVLPIVLQIVLPIGIGQYGARRSLHLVLIALL